MSTRLTPRRPLRRTATLLAATLVAAAGLTATATPAQAANPVVGLPVCHSSAPYGWQCGIVEAVNLTIHYADHAIHGVFRYRACAGPGDNATRVYNSAFETVGYVIGGSGVYPTCVTYAVPYPVQGHGTPPPLPQPLAADQ